MIRYQLIWYNYIAQEDQVDYILAKDENDAKEIAILWIKLWVGHDYSFAESSISSLSEFSESYDITRESVMEYYKQRNQKQ